MLFIGHFILLFGSDLSDYLSYIFLLFILVVFLISLCTSLCYYLAHFPLIEKSYFRCFLYMLFILYASSLRDRVTNSSVCLLLFIFHCDLYQIIWLFSFWLQLEQPRFFALSNALVISRYKYRYFLAHKVNFLFFESLIFVLKTY